MMSKWFLSLRDSLIAILVKRTVTVLTVVFCLATLIVLGNIYYFSQQLVQNQALEYAVNSVSALKKARVLYNTEVVTRLNQLNQIKVVHDYTENENAIPLPATYLRELGHGISQSNYGMRVRLYSDYPFPWREEDGGVKDEFEQQAIDFLRLNPTIPFYRIQNLNHLRVLRYAEADVLQMREVRFFLQHFFCFVVYVLERM